MPEWSNGPVSKSGVCHRTEGSNPSLSFETKSEAVRLRFLFQVKNWWMRTLAEGSIDRARAKRTQRGQGLRPPAVTRRAAKEQNVTEPSHPSLSLREGNGIETK